MTPHHSGHLALHVGAFAPAGGDHGRDRPRAGLCLHLDHPIVRL